MGFPNNGVRGDKLVRDNAVSALGKILLFCPNSNTKKELVPIFLNSLPLTCDFTENQYVYQIISHFIANQTSVIRPHFEQSLTLLGMALSDKEVPQETTQSIVKLFRKI